MSLAQIGEFSFVIAGLGAATASGAGTRLYAIAVAVATATAFTTPILAKRGGHVAEWLHRKLPHPVQTVASLYASWVELLVAPKPAHAPTAQWSRLIRLLLLDAAAVAIEIGRAHV